MQIYHITARSEWEKASTEGQYTAESLALEGFIHTSTREQVVETANRYYRGQGGLVLLEIAVERVKPEVRFDTVSRDGVPTAFPHIYGPLNTDAVVRVLPMEPGAGGEFSLPPELS
jgi:uncharacterized protein (DUF952 family)